jgi:hypothetical protein
LEAPQSHRSRRLAEALSDPTPRGPLYEFLCAWLGRLKARASYGRFSHLQLWAADRAFWLDLTLFQ